MALFASPPVNSASFADSTADFTANFISCAPAALKTSECQPSRVTMSVDLPSTVIESIASFADAMGTSTQPFGLRIEARIVTSNFAAVPSTRPTYAARATEKSTGGSGATSAPRNRSKMSLNSSHGTVTCAPPSRGSADFCWAATWREKRKHNPRMTMSSTANFFMAVPPNLRPSNTAKTVLFRQGEKK